jgi:tetratricopeptide (TPR) repeat protein
MAGKILSHTTVTALFFILFSSPVQATTVNMNAAREFVEKGEYSSAVPLLEEILSDTPNNAEGQYLMGVCTLWQDDIGAADGYFRKAFALNEALKAGVTGEFEKFIITRLEDDQVEVAQKAFDVLIRYQPSINARVSRACVDRGEAYLEEGQGQEADALFRFAASINRSLRGRICDIFFARAKAAVGEESLKLVLASIRYGDKYQNEAIRMILRLANSLDDPKAREGYLKEALQFIDPEVVFSASVEYFTDRWGQPQKITLVEPGRWIGVEKAKEKEKVCYLSRQSVRTRDKGGQISLKPNILTAEPFSGGETETDRGYVTEIWFSMDEKPVTVFFWIRD